MSSWEFERRLDFVEDQLIEFGRVSRPVLCRYFDLSPGHAGRAITAYCELNPLVMYDSRMKAFRWKDPAKPRPVRGSTPSRRAAWGLF